MTLKQKFSLILDLLRHLFSRSAHVKYQEGRHAGGDSDKCGQLLEFIGNGGQATRADMAGLLASLKGPVGAAGPTYFRRVAAAAMSTSDDIATLRTLSDMLDDLLGRASDATALAAPLDGREQAEDPDSHRIVALCTELSKVVNGRLVEIEYRKCVEDINARMSECSDGVGKNDTGWSVQRVIDLNNLVGRYVALGPQLGKWWAALGQPDEIPKLDIDPDRLDAAISKGLGLGLWCSAAGAPQSSGEAGSGLSTLVISHSQPVLPSLVRAFPHLVPYSRLLSGTAAQERYAAHVATGANEIRAMMDEVSPLEKGAGATPGWLTQRLRRTLDIIRYTTDMHEALCTGEPAAVGPIETDVRDIPPSQRDAFHSVPELEPLWREWAPVVEGLHRNIHALYPVGRAMPRVMGEAMQMLNWLRDLVSPGLAGDHAGRAGMTQAQRAGWREALAGEMGLLLDDDGRVSRTKTLLFQEAACQVVEKEDSPIKQVEWEEWRLSSDAPARHRISKQFRIDAIDRPGFVFTVRGVDGGGRPVASAAYDSENEGARKAGVDDFLTKVELLRTGSAADLMPYLHQGHLAFGLAGAKAAASGDAPTGPEYTAFFDVSMKHNGEIAVETTLRYDNLKRLVNAETDDMARMGTDLDPGQSHAMFRKRVVIPRQGDMSPARRQGPVAVAMRFVKAPAVALRRPAVPAEEVDDSWERVSAASLAGPATAPMVPAS